VSQNFSLHQNYRDQQPSEAGVDRAVGGILMVTGAAKAFVAERSLLSYV
jgi:hypothetical protein